MAHPVIEPISFALLDSVVTFYFLKRCIFHQNWVMYVPGPETY